MAKKKKKVYKKNNNINHNSNNNTKITETLLSSLKKRLFVILFVNLSLISTIFIFSPMDIFLRNQRDFGIGFFDGFIPMLITELGFFIIISVIMVLINEKMFNILSSLLFGLLIAFYIQMLFFNGNMAQLTGDLENYLEKSVSNYINLFLFLIIAFLPLALLLLNKKYSKKKKTPKDNIFYANKEKIMICVSSIIFLMQLCGLVGTVFSIGLNKIDINRRNLDYRLSYENTMNLSKENNIIVFLLDRLDGRWFDDFLEEYPEMDDELSGFTYYRNNIACYTNTFPSIPEMLTNLKYEYNEYNEDNWDGYLEKAWENSLLSDSLHKKGYDINLLLDKGTTYSDINYLFGKADNLKPVNENFEMNYIKENGIFWTMLKMSLGKLSPYFAKYYFLNGVNPDFSNNFIIYTADSDDDSDDDIDSDDDSDSNDDSDDIVKDGVGDDSDIDFYNYLTKHNINDSNRNKTFTFIHLKGAHGESEAITNLYQNSDSVTINSTLRGEFVIISEYIEQLKQLGIYDNSTIIILGDHGHPPYQVELEGAEELDDSIMTALLIKPQNSENNSLIINDTAELSNSNFLPSVFESAGIKNDDYGDSYFDIINNDLHPVRNFNLFNYNIPLGRYEVTDDAHNFDNWKFFKNS